MPTLEPITVCQNRNEDASCRISNFKSQGNQELPRCLPCILPRYVPTLPAVGILSTDLNQTIHDADIFPEARPYADHKSCGIYCVVPSEDWI